VTRDGQSNGDFVTSSTIDGHRFASEYLMASTGRFENNGQEEDLLDYVKRKLGASASGDHVPAANVPGIFELAMELDPLSLIHGFQISIKKRLTFVGLRSPRALTACILGYHCQQRPVPGVRLDPIGTGEAGQAIFQKERIVARDIEAKFSIDVGLLAGMRLAGAGNTTLQDHRFKLLLGLALWKVATLLKELEIERSLRTECKLRLMEGDSVKYTCNGRSACQKFDYTGIVEARSSNGGTETVLQQFIGDACLPQNRSPLTLMLSA
jgi:CRISPR-associated protein Csb1